MKLKDIVPYCLNTKNGGFQNKYYWLIQGETYYIESLQAYHVENMFDSTYKPYYRAFGDDNYNFINLRKHFNYQNRSEADYLSLNINNEITIFDKFIMVHRISGETTDTENKLFTNQHYFVAKNHDCSAEFYTIGLFHNDEMGGMATNLRTLFKDLILPPVQPKPADLTLDDKVDSLVDEIMKDSKTMAIKKLKRMLNERL